jgi:membrane protein
MADEYDRRVQIMGSTTSNHGDQPLGVPENADPSGAAGLTRQPTAGRPSSRWPGRVAIRSLTAVNRIELLDRSMTIAAQLFTSIFPILILFATWVTKRDADRIADATAMPKEAQSVLEDAVAAAGDTAFGVIGVVIVVFSATGISRALTRAYAAIWELPRPRSNVRSAWRWVSVVLALVVSLLMVRGLSRLASGLPPAAVWPATIAAICDAAVALFVPWVLLSGSIRPRLLVPGAVVAALVGLVARPLTEEWFPQAVADSADRYGSIGVAFTCLALLYVVSLVLLATAILGQVIATDSGRLGAWIRGTSRVGEQ